MSGTNNRAALEAIVEQFRKQCVNKSGGIGFEETVYQLDALLRQAEREALEGLKKDSEFAEKDLASGGTSVFEVVPVSAIDAALVALQVGPQGAEGDLGDSDSSGGVSGSEQIKSYATPDEPTEGSL